MCTLISRGGSGTRVGSTSGIRRHREPWGRFCLWDTLHDGRCPARACKGMNGEPPSFARRSSVTAHGRAYGARARGSRSAQRTRGSHAPRGRTGEPCPGGRGPGGRRTRSCEVRVMRRAEAGQVIVRARLGKGHWRADGYGNGHDQFGGGPLEKGRRAPRWRPTLLHVPFLGGWAGAIPPGYPAGDSDIIPYPTR